MDESTEEGEIKFKKNSHSQPQIFKYYLERKIGEGTFGKVFLSVYQGRKYALKQIQTDLKNGISITALREIKILKSLNHRNILKIVEIAVDRKCKTYDRLHDRIFIVFPHYNYDLSALIKKRDMTNTEIHFISEQICEGLKYLHDNGVIHRDLKSANILLNDDLELVICDFGLARYCEKGFMTPQLVTLWYRPPEILLGSTSYDFKVDIWGLGCIFCELLLKRPLMAGKSEIEQLELIINLCGSINPRTYENVELLPDYNRIKLGQGVNKILAILKGHDERFVNLIYKMLVVDPVKRLTIGEVSMHPYFKPYNHLKKTRQ